jgi:hypothetical protein
MVRAILLTFYIIIFTNCFAQVDTTYLEEENDKYFSFFSYESLSNKLYIGIENQFRISIPTIRTVDIFLKIDKQDLEFREVWRPMIEGQKWNNSLAEYTLITAQKKGAYFPDENEDSKKYRDTNGIYWEKEFIIHTRVSQEMNITIYVKDKNNLQQKFNTFKLVTSYIPDPNITINDLSYFEKNEVLTPNFDLDFKKGVEWYKVLQYNFIALDKKGEIIKSITIYGDEFTQEIRELIQDKKVKSIRIIHIKSARHTYTPIEVKNDMK